MNLTKLKRSDLSITPLAFGAWAIGGWMWGGAEKKDAIKALEKSFDLGITSIDTAPVYGFGLSEEIVGEAYKGKRDKIQILTKFGLSWSGKKGQFFFSSTDNNGNPVDIYRNASKERVIQECDESLKRLHTDYIDLLQIHWPDPSTPLEETMEALNILIDQGKIRAAGVSNYDMPLLDDAVKITNIVSNQVPYSMLRRDIEADLVPWCLKNNIDILAYSPLQRGILTGKFNPDHHFNDGDTRNGLPWYKKENIVKINLFLEDIKPLAESKKASLSQLVLRWTLEQPGITCVLAGARNPEQIVENAGAMSFSLSDDEMTFINGKLAELDIESTSKT